MQFRIISTLFALAFSFTVNAETSTKIERLRMQAAQDAILAIGMDAVPMPKPLVDYLRVVAVHIIDTNGGFLFNIPEATARKKLVTQIGFQAGKLAVFCVLEDVNAEGLASHLSSDDLRSLCLDHDDDQIKEILDQVGR